MKKKNSKTVTGHLPENVGFHKMEQGYVLSLEEQLKQIRATGATVEETTNGIIITPPAGKVHTKLPAGYR